MRGITPACWRRAVNPAILHPTGACTSRHGLLLRVGPATTFEDVVPRQKSILA
jgi:hypothetical protein